MKKIIILSILFISLAFTAPMQASAATNAGVKPGSFFYFLDTTFENVGLFFTFNPEKKVQKALEYADERLAEIEVVAEEKNPDAVKTAIANYESNIALATEKSKEVKDKGRAETLFTSIADNSSRNQEVLAAVLIKVPEEAREAITQAIEASRKGQEEATKQIAELKGEVEKLRQEITELKSKDGERTQKIEELSNQKTENSTLQPKAVAPQSQTVPKIETPKTTIITLPNGAIAEMDTSGNILHTIKEAPTTSQTQNTTGVQISNVNTAVGISSVRIEWSTNIPTNSKLFLTDPDGAPHVYTSPSGFSTSHFVNMVLAPGLTFSYEIEAIANGISTKKNGSFLTKSLPIDFTVSIEGNGNETKLYFTSNQRITSDNIKIIKGEWATSLWDQRFGKGWDCDDGRQACLEYKNSINETFSQLQFCESCGSSDKPFVYRFTLSTPLENFVEISLNPNQTKSFTFRIQLTGIDGDSKQSTNQTCNMMPEEFFAKIGRGSGGVQDRCFYQ